MAGAPEDSETDDAGRPRNDAGTDELLPVVYAQLRALAQQRLGEERPGHTLQATALVHEVYLRLADAGVSWSSPGLFYHAAAEAMRRILIEHCPSSRGPEAWRRKATTRPRQRPRSGRRG